MQILRISVRALGAFVSVLAGASAVVSAASGCTRSDPGSVTPDRSRDAAAIPSATASAALADAPGAPRAGMVWIPAGVLRAGTPADRTPRIADEELPGTETPMSAFYIDLLPYPNEAGAIPMSNVTRDDAEKQCETKGKRLCTEFEWERACKGPDNTAYEYGDAYRAAPCGTGLPVEESARHPSGEHVSCKSGFGVLDMHGEVWEWTDSPWRRGSKSELGVLRGGNSRAGELVGRCANALGRNVTSKSASMGFRCCAGTKNAQENELVVRPLTPLERSMKPKDLASDLVPLGTKKWGADGAGAFVPTAAWTWHPVANEELVIAAGCAHPPDAPGKKGARCGVIIGRVDVGRAPSSDAPSASNGASDGGARDAPASPGLPSTAVALLEIDSGHVAADVAQFGEARRLRMRGLDNYGTFLREITYSYGRVELGDTKRR